jgi:hypothetical protein
VNQRRFSGSRAAWMPTDQIGGPKAHGTSPAMTR